MNGTLNKNLDEKSNISTSIAVWLPVSNGEKAAEFYKNAFGAIETYRLEGPDGSIVVKLSIDGSAFWLSGESSASNEPAIESPGTGAIRMILTVKDPDSIFAMALQAGAKKIFPVGEEHGWKLGRIMDPFGYHWEIGHEL